MSWAYPLTKGSNMGFAGHFVSWVLVPRLKTLKWYMDWAVFSPTAKTSQAAYRHLWPLSPSSIAPFLFWEKGQTCKRIID